MVCCKKYNYRKLKALENIQRPFNSNSHNCRAENMSMDSRDIQPNFGI